MGSLVDETLLRDFLADSGEHLNAIEPDLLAMESQGPDLDPEVINRVFRAIHSIKGFSAFLGFEKVTELGHAMEHLLMRFRDGLASPNPDSVDALLAGVDKLRTMIMDIQASDQVSCQAELDRLRAALSDGPGAPSTAAAPPAAPPAAPSRAEEGCLGQGPIKLEAPGEPGRGPMVFALEPAQLGQVVEGDLSLYAVWVDIGQDIIGQGCGMERLLADLESCGQCLVSDLSDDASGQGVGRCLFATLIEEPEIAGAALDLPIERLYQFPKEQVRAAWRAGGGAQAATQGPPPGAATSRVASLEGPEGLSFACQASDLELAQARERELHLFAVWVHPQRDLKDKGRDAQAFLANLATCGGCLATDLDRALAPGQAYGHCLFATLIEEPEIAALALDVPEDQVRRVSTEAVPEPAAPAPPAPPTLAVATPARPAPPAPAPAPAPAPLAAPPEVSWAKAPATCTETIRVSVPLVDKLINLAGEMVLGRNQLRRLLGEATRKEPLLGSVLQKVDLVTSDLQENIMQLRMQPVGSVFNKFPRLVRDLSRQLGKDVELNVMGGEVELDKSILEQLSDPLTHLIRNCVDHGIESPEERQALAKPRAGRIVLKAFHKEGLVNITIDDDGRGIDPEAVARRALAAGKIRAEELERLGPSEKLNLITLPGVSTAKQVTDISGRGVGMDVVATNIQKISGHLQIDSEPGQGSCMRLRLPLTLAIMPSLVVGAGGQVFAIPQVDVQELLCIQSRVAAQRIEMVGEAQVVRLRERLLPLVRLRDVLGLRRTIRHGATSQRMEDRRQRLADRRQTRPIPEAAALPRSGGERRRRRADDIFVVVLRLGDNRFGLIVDELFDTEEIVVKPLSRHIKDCRCFGGTTIMGDGRVAMILDAAGIVEHARLRFSEIQAEDARRLQELNRRREAQAGPSMSLVVFQYASGEYFALPLEQVARLELVKPELIQLVGGRECVQYRDGGLALLRLERHLPVGAYPSPAISMYVIIPKGEDQQVGIVASSIVDIVDSSAAVRPYQGPHRGLAGMLNLHGRLILLLKGEELLRDYRQRRPVVDAPLIETGAGQ
ncbi:MAG: chemotaxis protein CheW [Pseudomonadota bacterium]